MFQHVNNHTRDHLLTNLLKTDEIKEDTVMVTSTHHQMMIAGKEGEVLGIAVQNNDFGGKGLSNLYHSAIKRDHPDYDTEVVWYDKTKSLCFQPHPEYTVHSGMTNYFFKLVEHFFKKDG